MDTDLSPFKSCILRDSYAAPTFFYNSAAPCRYGLTAADFSCHKACFSAIAHGANLVASLAVTLPHTCWSPEILDVWFQEDWLAIQFAIPFTSFSMMYSCLLCGDTIGILLQIHVADGYAMVLQHEANVATLANHLASKRAMDQTTPLRTPLAHPFVHRC